MHLLELIDKDSSRVFMHHHSVIYTTIAIDRSPDSMIHEIDSKICLHDIMIVVSREDNSHLIESD